ncbi:MAG: uroporphyrinogen decarboxylase family protein [Planctomycetota bacterium]
MEWLRDEYIALMKGEKTDRQMFVELFGPLLGLEDEWRDQGASEEEVSLVAFDWDYIRRVHVGANTEMMGGYEPAVLEDTPEYRITRDALGRTMKLCKDSATIPLPLDFPVKTMDDWIKIKPWFEDAPDRVNEDALAASAKERAENGALAIASIPGGFDLPRQLMGEEELCMAYYTDPELIRDILTTVGDTAVSVLSRVTESVTVDHLAVHEDMAGKSGSLIGPNLIEEFIAPYYRRCWDVVKSTGGTFFMQDSDGDMTSVIQAFRDCGLNAMHPFEPAAGMDIVKVREEHGSEFYIKGGIDKHVLRGTQAEIRAELEYKMQASMQQGGVVFGLDHRIPNGTPLENYRYYVDTGREILGLPPRDGSSKGWQRMAG